MPTYFVGSHCYSFKLNYKITVKLAGLAERQQVCKMEGSGKMYYGIREVAEQFGIKTSKLRFYETEFPTLKPKKNSSGDRIYTKADIDHLTEILDLINNQKYTLPGARAFLEERENRRQENARYINKLKRIKTFLEQMRDGLGKTEIPLAENESETSA